MFHGTFLQTIRFKEDITRIHIEISMVFEDFIHTFCPAYIFSEKRYNRCTHCNFNGYSGFYPHVLSYNP